MSASTIGAPKITIEIEDSGIGIDPLHIKTIYDPFTQVDQSVMRKYGGIGMGLTIVRNLVSLMNGEITLDSTLGKGSLFKITIPYKSPEITSIEKEEESTTTHPSPRLLLIDDNDEVRIMLGEILKSLGYSVDDFSLGRLALDFARNIKFDAVLLDINMPEMDGFAVAAKLRDMPMHRETPIIWISATKSDLVDRERSSIFTHFLEKPIHASALKRLLESILNNNE
jgi:CheY-like chemotaxis protein